MEIYLGIAIASILLSVVSLVGSVFVLVMFLAKEKSQHTVQMVPVDSFVGPADSKPIDFDPPTAFEEFDSPGKYDNELSKLDSKLRKL